ncbi:RagB/SusD family nutrient uptake outer membrane protein [Terrimonas sp.]|uniref:RagB/SusD family nutrient uptake outer membrane protein n=1 Tax=Terrimonas sp. TaxID=1914338 RepID=UPI000D51736B|nr:RagB/SusD family nutrient uptake outer membrane protein [Terrimonas sp.]PVD50256.1 RagB/SusD family nutrient uptake outer membrane protein [Terrimonas sp.]
MKYNNIYLIIAATLGTVIFSSCKKFLEEDPKSQVTITNYYKTEADAISAVNSIYAYLNSISTGTTAGVYHSTFWVTMGLASDELLNNQVAAPQFDQLATFTYTSQNSALEEIWAMHYKTITIANIAIARIPGIAMNESLKNRLVGEAKFLRALMYFNMVRMFGSIPLLVEENNPLTPPPASAETIYAQITSDLDFAADNLPDSYDPGNGRGRATNGAANALLAKVYLTQKQWDKAATTAKKVIDSNRYALWEDFADVFKLSSRNGKEAIFSVGFGDAGGAIIFWEAGQFQVRLLPPDLSVEGVKNAQGWQIPTEYLYNRYDADDRRRAVTFITEINDPATGPKTIRPYIQKYWDRAAEPTGNESSNDFPVLRYADVLLMYAEASNELGQTVVAEEYINKIRKRARFNGTNYLPTVPDYSGLSKDQVRDAIIKERLLEFVAEGQRWFDLARTNTLTEKVPLAKPGVTPQTKNYLFPIPQREIDLNNSLEQNTGY